MTRSMAMPVVTGLAVVLGALCGLARAAGEPPVGQPSAAPDLSTPRAAAAAVTRALEEGDAAVLAAVSTGDEKHLAWARAEASQWRALRGLEAALAGRFGKEWAKGDAGTEAHDLIDTLRNTDLRTDLKAAKLAEVHGDAVVWAVNDTDPDDLQPRLVRADGRWRLDLASLTEYADVSDAPVLAAVAKAAEGLTKDVAAGKFASVDEAAEAIDDRLTAAERDAAAAEAAKPDKGPTTAPAATPVPQP